jgi:hypothetical protein
MKEYCVLIEYKEGGSLTYMEYGDSPASIAWETLFGYGDFTLHPGVGDAWVATMNNGSKKVTVTPL